MNPFKRFLETTLPRPLYRALLAPYHLAIAILSAARYGFPGRSLIVIGVTGTKGKSTVCEMLAAIFREEGRKVALSSTIHFSIGDDTLPNLYKMTLPGRGFIQRFLRDARKAKCEVAIIEITSESALQYRHLFLSLDALVFTNLQEEHLESHGGMENYFRAKMRIGMELAASDKRTRVIVANADDVYGRRFLELPVEKRVPFRLSDVQKTESLEGNTFVLGDALFTLNVPGDFNILNALAAIKTADAFGIPYETAAKGLKALARIKGRTEEIHAGQDFLAIVDYAHTPDSLRALYSAYPDTRKICVLGNTGGGRDTWKRPLMAQIAEAACDEVILTDEDPYDEDPRAIIDEMKAGMKKEPRIVMNRREAIRTALSLARSGDTVIVSGKGTDPFIMEAGGAKTPWSDAQVVKEELERLLH